LYHCELLFCYFFKSAASVQATNPVRRSPRVAATVQSTVASERVSSPGKSRLGHRKRKIDVDETYVPDSTEDGVAAGKVIFVCSFLHNSSTVNFFVY
jgi:hypothetical protein